MLHWEIHTDTDVRDVHTVPVPPRKTTAETEGGGNVNVEALLQHALDRSDHSNHLQRVLACARKMRALQTPKPRGALSITRTFCIDEVS